MPPLLAIVTLELIELEKNNFFYQTLDEVLRFISSRKQTTNNAASLIKRKLSAIIHSTTKKPDEYQAVLELLNNIRDDSSQRRETINQKIDIALKGKASLSQHGHSDECEKIRKAYHCCMILIRFNNKTGLLYKTAEYYNEVATNNIKTICHLDIKPISDSIMALGKSPKSTLLPLSKDMPPVNINELVTDEFDTLIESIHGEFQEQKSNVFIYLTASLWELLEIRGNSVDFLEQGTMFDEYCLDDEELKPLKLILDVCILVQKNLLSEAVDKLDSPDALCLEFASPELLYKTATLYIGCQIKIGKISHLRFEPLAKIILDTQSLFSDISVDDGKLLGMRFQPLVNDHYSLTLLRCVREYNEMVLGNLSNGETESMQAILDSLDPVELAIRKLDVFRENIQPSRLRSLIAKKLTKHERNDNLISFLPDATLYRCIRELANICCYLYFTPQRHPAIEHLIRNYELRIPILKALNPTLFKKECFTDNTF